MGPIKINITTDTSEYGGGEAEAPDVGDKAESAPKVEKGVDDKKGPGDDQNGYEYEGEDCFYTEPSSGARYKWCKESSSWTNTVTGERMDPGRGSGEAEAAAQQNYKMEDGTYVYVDRLTNKKHKWNLETSQWDVVENDEEPEEDESEEDENITEEERKARQYRKRKAAPGWDQANYQKVSLLK